MHSSRSQNKWGYSVASVYGSVRPGSRPSTASGVRGARPRGATRSTIYATNGAMRTAPVKSDSTRSSSRTRSSSASKSSSGKIAKKKKKKARGLSFNLLLCSNTSRDIMRALIRKYGWTETDNEGCDVLWTDQRSATSMDSFRLLSRGKVSCTNHFPLMQRFVTKSAIGNALSFFHSLHPAAFDFYPQSWDLRSQFREFEGAYRRDRTYIVKPSNGRQGDGIKLFQKFSDFLRIVETHRSDDLVVQEYVAKPQLLDGIKFDMRIYVLVESLDPLKFHVFKDGLARMCTETYEEPCSANIEDTYMHLTNYSLNKKSAEFIKSNKESGQKVEDVKDKSSKRSIRTALAQLRRQRGGVDIEGFWKETEDLVAKTLIAMTPDLWGARSHFFPSHHIKGDRSGAKKSGMSDSSSSSTASSSSASSGDNFPWRTNSQTHTRPVRPASAYDARIQQLPRHNGNCFCEQGLQASTGILMDEQVNTSTTYAQGEKRRKKKNIKNRMFQLVGFDVLMDEKLKLWLLEVNSSPSFGTDTELDFRIKRSVVERTLHLLGYITEKQASPTPDAVAAKKFAPAVGSKAVNRANGQSILDMSAMERLTGRPDSMNSLLHTSGRNLGFDWRELPYCTLEPEFRYDELLWFKQPTVQCMFTAYSSKAHSQVRGLTATMFSRLLRQHDLVGKHFNIAEADLVYLKLLKSHGEKILTFPLFLKALLIISKRLFTESSVGAVQAFEKLLQLVEQIGPTTSHLKQNKTSNNHSDSCSSSASPSLPASHDQQPVATKPHAIRRSMTSPGRMTLKSYTSSKRVKRTEQEQEESDEEKVIILDGLAVVPTTDSLDSGEEAEEVPSGNEDEDEEGVHRPSWLSTVAPPRRRGSLSLSTKARGDKATLSARPGSAMQLGYMRERRSRDSGRRASEHTGETVNGNGRGFIRGESANYRTVMSKRRGDVDISHVGNKSTILRSSTLRERPATAKTHRSSWNNSVTLPMEHAAPVRGLSRRSTWRSKWMN
jgi:hypothetical protein